MKVDKIFLMLILLLTLCVSVNATIIASSEIVDSSQIYVQSGGLKQSFKVVGSDYAVIQSIEVIAFNNDVFATPLYLTILDEFNGNQTIYQSSKAVYDTPNQIIYNANDLDIIGGRTYWLVFTGYNGISLFGDESGLDTYPYGTIYEYPNADLFFIINGYTYDDIDVQIFDNNRDIDSYITGAQYYEDYDLFVYFNYTEDLYLEQGEFWFKYETVSSGSISYFVYVQELNNSVCSQNLSISAKNNSCWNTIIPYTNIGITPSWSEPWGVGGYGRLVKLSVDFSIDDTIIKGTNKYRVGWYFDHVGTTRDDGYYLLNNVSNDNVTFPSMLGSNRQDTSITYTDLNTDFVYYSNLNATSLQVCTGDFCDGLITENETTSSNTTAFTITEEDTDIIFMGVSDSENATKFTLKGLFVTLLILIFIGSSVYIYSSSLFVLLSVTFRVLLLCSVLYFIPFYIPLVLLIIMIGYKIFSKFFIEDS